MPVPTRHNPDAGGDAAMEFAMAAGMADGRGEGGSGAAHEDAPTARHANDEVDEWVRSAGFLAMSLQPRSVILDSGF